MKAKNAQEVRSEHKEDWGLWLIALFIIVAAITYFARMHSAQGMLLTDSCWTYPSIQQSYLGQLIDQQQFVVEEGRFDGCRQQYFVPNPDEACCKVGGSIVPVEFEADGASTEERIEWFCRRQDIKLGPTNGQFILFDTDVYVGFLPDPTCYEP